VRFPALFVSHGAPSAALDDDDYTRALHRWARGRPRPRAIVVVSAHGEAPAPLRVSAGERPSLIYDFYGFPPELYRLTWPAPGEPELAGEIAATLADAGHRPVLDRSRGWDHGVWVPLRLMYPDADVPVVEISLPVPRTPELLLSIGTALAPLRDRDVLLFGSGGVVHNLRRLGAGPEVAGWALSFDRWVGERLLDLDVPSLCRYETAAPHADLAVPTTEHFDPLFFTLGSARPTERVLGVYEGFAYASLSLRSFEVGPA